MDSPINLGFTRLASPPSLRRGVDWSIAGPLLLAHGISCTAPWTFSWFGLAAYLLLYLISGFGVTIGAHRYFTHATFVARPWLRYTLAVAFLLSAQGSLLRSSLGFVKVHPAALKTNGSMNYMPRASAKMPF
jgi:hypothetical protein